MFIGIFVSILIRPIFQSRYLFFIYPIYLCLTIYELYLNIKQNQHFKIFTIIIMLFLSLGLTRNFAKGIKFIKCDYDITSYVQKTKVNRCSKTTPSYSNNSYFTIQYSIYLPSKKLIIPKQYKRIQLETIQTGNLDNDEKLFNALYPNIKFSNKKSIKEE